MAVTGSMCRTLLTKLSLVSRLPVFNTNVYRCTSHRYYTTNSTPKVDQKDTASPSAGPAEAETQTKTEAQKKVETESKTNGQSPAEPSEQEKKMTEQIEKLETQLKEMKDKYVRSLAEAENIRQRMRKQVDDAKAFGIQGFCKDLLEVADILAQATESVPKEALTEDNPHLNNLYEGLKMTNSQLLKVFNKHGLSVISPVEGDKFDPFIHEAMFQVPTTEKKENTIAAITKTGYKLHERTIRPAIVGVFKESGV